MPDLVLPLDDEAWRRLEARRSSRLAEDEARALLREALGLASPLAKRALARQLEAARAVMRQDAGALRTLAGRSRGGERQPAPSGRSNSIRPRRTSSRGSSSIARRIAGSAPGGQALLPQARRARTPCWRLLTTGLRSAAATSGQPRPGKRRRSWSTKPRALWAHQTRPRPRSSAGPVAIASSGSRSSSSATTRPTRPGSSVRMSACHGPGSSPSRPRSWRPKAWGQGSIPAAGAGCRASWYGPRSRPLRAASIMVLAARPRSRASARRSTSAVSASVQIDASSPRSRRSSRWDSNSAAAAAWVGVRVRSLRSPSQAIAAAAPSG